MYKVDSPDAVDFINHQEIIETLEYARAHRKRQAGEMRRRVLSLLLYTITRHFSKYFLLKLSIF